MGEETIDTEKMNGKKEKGQEVREENADTGRKKSE